MAEDVDWIASTAMQQDPSLEHGIACELAGAALKLAPVADPPELARQLLSAHASYGASAANAVAVATVDYLARVEP